MRIGLSFSGGGFRSAGFSLGVLKYLNDIELLSHVKTISSVSGGSITALKYLEMLHSEEEFNFIHFYNELYHFLESNKLHSEAIRTLNDFNIWTNPLNRHKKRNLINSFAIQFDMFLNFNTLYHISKKDKHVKEFIINASDISNAHIFRFRLNGGKFGNSKTPKVSNTHKRNIKLGDILAASSCFPGGFEPIVFPKDFFDNGQDKPNQKEILLMDGGILDNQGLDHFNKYPIKYDLIIVSDVESSFIKQPIALVENKTFNGWFQILTSYAIPLISLGFIYLFYLIKCSFGIGFFTSLVIIFVLIRCFIKLKLAKLSNELGLENKIQFQSKIWGNYLFDRLATLFFLGTTVFLKNNRSRIIEDLFKSKNTSQGKNLKIAHIMLSSSFKLVSSNKLIKLLKQAENFGTTLWFNKEEKSKPKHEKMLETLIAGGQAKTCYTLLKLLEKESTDTLIIEKLKKDWISFNENPFWNN